ncbi:MAG: sll0787 family AIR synthase-like protein [Pseudomonadota bacterium]
MSLAELLGALQRWPGIEQKTQVQRIVAGLQGTAGDGRYPNGDDTAVIATENGFDLLAMEGLFTPFVEADPWFAGWCSIMVNLSDVAAMGGRSVAVVNALWGRDNHDSAKIMAGMSDASKAFQVPIVGGHTHLSSDRLQLAVGVLGRANTLLSGFAAEPGHAIVAAIDLRGQYRPPFLNWNAATDAPTQRLRGDLELLPKIADAGLAISAKDISQAGLLGTLVMLLECSEVGAEVELARIPRPASVDWLDWLTSFPSFGYLLTTPQGQVEALLRIFRERDISADCIGVVQPGSQLNVHYQEESGLFWDTSVRPLTGMGPSASAVADSARANEAERCA